jgi:hypothetical protein
VTNRKRGSTTQELARVIGCLVRPDQVLRHLESMAGMLFSMTGMLVDVSHCTTPPAAGTSPIQGADASAPATQWPAACNLGHHWDKHALNPCNREETRNSSFKCS